MKNYFFSLTGIQKEKNLMKIGFLQSHFYDKDIFRLNEDNFDVIISKDSFEHIFNLSIVLKEIKKKLKKGGKLYSGFGPLYNAYNGAHDSGKFLIPWDI